MSRDTDVPLKMASECKGVYVVCPCSKDITQRVLRIFSIYYTQRKSCSLNVANLNLLPVMKHKTVEIKLMD